ncbi:MAG: hypothetical protein Q8K56_00965 [Rhodoglobus sp.]|nr:hypothetical protein [Rhodoglobus sp.]
MGVGVDCAVDEALCLEPSAAHGFTISQAEVPSWALFTECQRSGKPTI